MLLLLLWQSVPCAPISMPMNRWHIKETDICPLYGHSPRSLPTQPTYQTCLQSPQIRDSQHSASNEMLAESLAHQSVHMSSSVSSFVPKMFSGKWLFCINLHTADFYNYSLPVVQMRIRCCWICDLITLPFKSRWWVRTVVSERHFWLRLLLNLWVNTVHH